MSVEHAIVLRAVSKRFGSLVAVNNLSLDVPAGACVGLLGPNGAGKSTLMRLLTGQAIADEGTIDVLGHRLPHAARDARARCGVVPQADNLDEELTVAENLLVYARLQRIPRSERRQAVTSALELARLTDRADTPTDELSGGMRRRLLIARGTLHRPDLVLLDEPTVGLDPQIRYDLWTQIEDLKSRGVTVLLSTHYMEEAERLSDVVAIMHAGRLVAFGSPRSLIDRHIGAQVLEISGSQRHLAGVEELARNAGLTTRLAGSSLTVVGADDADEFARGQGVLRAANLEDVFVALTGAQLA
jgi:lipooligosaccharide transport system ATP-binding protein